MVELWQLHIVFMVVFFGMPIMLAYYQYKKWKRKGNESLLKQIKKDLGMDF